MYKVLVTTSGIGSRLGDITSYTNKSLVRVGDKPALSYIIESYPEDIEIVVTVGHFASHVKQFLSIAYPNRKFTFVEVNKYKGPGSSLAYSILAAKNEVNCPFIFHACDTIVTSFIPEPANNWLGGSPKESGSDHYVSFDVSGDTVAQMRDKGDFFGDYNYIGLAGINDFEIFFNELEAAYESDVYDLGLSDVSSIKKMLGKDILFRYQNMKWYDIGNTDSLQLSRKVLRGKLNVLDKDDESIFRVNNHIIKFFYDNQISKNRVLRAERLKGLVPDIVDHTDNFYKYPFVEGELLADSITEAIFEDFLKWAQNNLWKKCEFSGDFKETCSNFYLEKTKKRLSQFLNKSGVKDEECSINGIITPSVKRMIEEIDANMLCNDEPYRFHGDFILDNALRTGDGFKLVDWRQDFGGSIEAGDIYYDFAKLNHNLVFNHDIVSKNLFKVTSDVSCDILRSHNLVNCQNILFKFLNDNGFNIKKVKLLTAIIWINMAPLHHYPLSNFLYYFGRYSLFKELNE